MLWLLMGGNRYAHQSFDKDGKLEKYRELEISKVTQGKPQLEILVKLYGYNRDGTVADTTETTLQCNEDGGSMLMNVLVLLGTEGGEVEAQISGDELRYPGYPSAKRFLKDITLKAKLKSGAFASMLGTRVTAVLKERWIYALNADDDSTNPGFGVEEVVVIKFYALGIKIKERSYRNYTIIRPKYGLIEQRLTSSDNSYILLKLLPE